MFSSSHSLGAASLCLAVLASRVVAASESYRLVETLRGHQERSGRTHLLHPLQIVNPAVNVAHQFCITSNLAAFAGQPLQANFD
jgi:hypothetical protein